MRTSLSLFFVVLLGIAPVAAYSQEQAAPSPGVAKIQALESKLAKMRDTSPEAAAVTLELIDAYYAEGQVFGLIRSGQNFVTAFTSHPQHKAVMLKTLDGLVATSRNKETVTLGRQFLQRYPDAAEVVQVERTLAVTFEQLEDRPKAAEMYHSVWNRLGDTPDGRKAALRAWNHYSALGGSKDLVTKIATLDESVLEKLPVGEFAARFGLDAVIQWQRIGDAAKSNAAGQKLLKKKLPTDDVAKAFLHAMLAQNDTTLGQRANAVENLRKARSFNDTRDLLSRMITESFAANAPADKVKELVDEYFKKYPAQPDRFTYKSYLPSLYLKEKNRTQALKLAKELLVEDAGANNAVLTYVNEAANDPSQYAAVEKTLLDAIAAAPSQAGPLRYALALYLYRDRMKDLDKARATVREMIAESPMNQQSDAISWLLFNPESDAKFAADVKLILKSREKHFEKTTFRNALSAWIQQAKGNKDLKERMQLVRAAVDEADADEFVQTWAASESQGKGVLEARAKLLAAPFLKKLTDAQARLLFQRQGEAYRSANGSETRRLSVDVYSAAVKRFPNDFLMAQYYFESAFDYGTPETAREAAANLLKLTPTQNLPEVWRRLMQLADKTEGDKFVRSVWDWVQASQKAFGPDYNNAALFGDVLDRHGMSAEGQAYWKAAAESPLLPAEARSCVERMITKTEGAARAQLLRTAFDRKTDYHGYFALVAAQDALKTGDLKAFEKALRDSRKLQDERGNRIWGLDDYQVGVIVEQARANKDLDEAARRTIYETARDMNLARSQALARSALLELDGAKMKPMERMLAYQQLSTLIGNDASDWDALMTFAQAAMIRKDYVDSATLVTGMLANVSAADSKRKQTGRDLVGQSYARMGAAGLSIDESSPIAPLLQAALYLRLGDERLAFDSYNANRKLFDDNREQMPVDLVLFVCESHIAAGGDENHDRAEDILRNWLVKNSESKDVESTTKASVQLLLAKNFFKSQRFDVARSEFQTVVNRWAGTPQAIEAEFGIGESFMAQKVYDQAEQVFEKLVNSKDRDVVIRAEFLRGVLANRRGDREEARDIFKNVLDRVPSVELANQALFNLSEVYGAEQRYMDQLELLRTVGRLGRSSERWHAPGTALAIVVQDSDLGISRGHARIPVRVTTQPGGDEEIIYLYSGGAGKGLFRADLETRLGQVEKGDKVLQLTGLDVIKCDYPEEFKAEFKNVPLSDAEIRIAADGKFEVASTQIIDEKEESFSERLEREARERRNQFESRAAERPKNQIKPGNVIYLRVQDSDRDVSDRPDEISVKLVATSGDQVQAKLQETGPHTGVFEATAQTGDLPAGAVASDTSIDHSPLMAIDRDPATFWLSEPDGATPKSLSVDMKDLKTIDSVTITAPKADQQIAVRGDVEASNDGRFWFKLASYPPQPAAEPIGEAFGKFTRSVYTSDLTKISDWSSVVSLAKNQKPVEQSTVFDVAFTAPNDSESEKVRQLPHSVIWHGKFVQPKTGTARIAVEGYRTAVSVDGKLELPIGPTARSIDLYLEAGTHDLTIFAATTLNGPTAGAKLAREDHSAVKLEMLPFTAADFDLARPEAKPAVLRAPATLEVAEGKWQAKFAPIQARHVRFVINEFLGEAVAVSQFEVRNSQAEKPYVPTEADVLSLASNDILEIAAGDKVTATYSDELTQTGSGRGQLLTASLQATYYNGLTTSIAYDFVRQANGAVQEIRKELVRIDPGQRLIIDVTDFDADVSVELDKVKMQVQVNDGPPMDLEAQEVAQSPGNFRKEVDTSATAEEGKLTVKPGDRIICRYIDEQNTFPGHAVPREATVYVAEPTAAKIRIVETRFLKLKVGSNAPAKAVYLPAADKAVSNVAFEAPLTIEVVDPDAARDSLSKTTVKLLTTGGATIDVECVIANDPAGGRARDRRTIEDGRFIGQVIMQLGGKDSPDIVPLVAGMPRNLLGGGKLSEEDQGGGEEVVVTRVLNVMGKDVIDAKYADALRPADAPTDVAAQGRLIANATLACVDRDYERDITQLHVGEKMFLRVVDADLDATDERDHAKLLITTERGDREEIELEETLAHSGVFTGSVLLKPQEKATPGNSLGEPTIEAYFGDKITVQYVDKAASTETGELTLSLDVPVVVGTDGLVAAFSKTFGDETLAVETQFHIAESYFELFKSHQKLERSEEQKADLESGRRVLREVMEDYPNPKYVARIAYLLGQFAQELKDYDEAIDNYQLIVKQYPDSTLAADAQFKLAQCYEEQGDVDQALEAYVTLAATYPKSPLIANVMLRICEYFWVAEKFEISAQVAEKFLERFEGHEWAAKMAYRIGQCYTKAEDFKRAAVAYDRFTKDFPDDELCALAWFWAGESFYKGGDSKEAFRRFNWCRWKFPESEAAKYARGRLQLPEMLNQFESEAKSIDNDK